ncbi:MAG: type II toxin-antitoxin system HicB family antitoxin [Candidatus Hydrogenedentes bacterium]|nr:type II toxin-antitoxin system HicB family antitoxin [Candidatus Hydrogenedentota bacterium]
MLTEYVQAAMCRAQYEKLEDDGTYFGSIPDCQGAWANEATLEACRAELQSALEDWILYRVSKNLSLPIINGLDLTIREVV